jgi:hypothetical protein
MTRREIAPLRANVKVRFQGSGVSRIKKNKRYTDSPAFLVKIRNPPLLPVGLQVDLDRADDRFPVKALEDRLVELEAPEVRGVEDVFLVLVVGETPGD